jgi:putative serine protease PepD
MPVEQLRLPAIPVRPQGPAGSGPAGHGPAPVGPGGTAPGSLSAPPTRKTGQGVSKAAVWGISMICALLAAVLAGGGVWFLMDHNQAQPQAAATATKTTEQVADVSSGNNTASLPAAPAPGEAVDWTTVASAVASTVVAIQVDMDSYQGGAQGSGVIINSQKGYIVTNNHVVADGRSIDVVLSDGRVFAAEVVGTDASTDLAVLQLNSPPSDLKEAVLGDSTALRVGEPVMAVGNPLGYDNTVTTGIVSALNRPVTTEAAGSGSSNVPVVTNAIQVDAAVNPGNSGGPLFNSAGEVVGINSSIATLSSYSDTAGSIGLAFAIPVNLVKSVSSQLIESGSAEHPYLGVTAEDAHVQVEGATRSGAQILQVQRGTPAEEIGLENGDVILYVDGNPVTGATSLTAWVRSYLPGDAVTLTVLRDGEPIDIEATLTVRDD